MSQGALEGTEMTEPARVQQPYIEIVRLPLDEPDEHLDEPLVDQPTHFEDEVPRFEVIRSPLDGSIGLMLGLIFSLLLFLAIPFAQMLGDVKKSRSSITETIVVVKVPDIETIEEELIEQERNVPEPELETAAEPQLLTLDQLDIALNPGTGGSANGPVGDFSLPDLGRLASATSTTDVTEYVDFGALDQLPRPIGITGLNFPRHLRKKAAQGTIVLMLKLGPEGEVIEVSIHSSDLPRFDSFVLGQVKQWRFTPPTKNGHPVHAQAKLPMPIRIR